MYGELASVKGIVDLSPQDSLDSAEGFLASQGYIIEQRTFTTVFAQRQAEGEEEPLSLTVAVAPQAGGGVRVTIRGTDEAGIRERQAAWTEWSESLPKRPEPADAPMSEPPQVENVDLPPPPQVGRDFATTAQTPQEGRRTGLSNPYTLGCLGIAGLLLFAIVVAGIIGTASSGGNGNGGGEVAEKPKQERGAGEQEPPQKNELPRQEPRTQGGKQEQQGGGEQEPEPQKPEPQEPKQEPEPQEPTFASFGDGTYQVGTDLQPGTYRTRQGSPNCYWERLRNFSGGINGILANGGTSAPSIITIEQTDAGFHSEGCGTWTKDLSAITGSKTSFGAGAYIVGTDIESGTYRNSGGNNCYYERLRGFNGGIGSIITNGGTGNPTIVTIAPTDEGFQSDGCGTWTKLQ